MILCSSRAVSFRENATTKAHLVFLLRVILIGSVEVVIRGILVIWPHVRLERVHCLIAAYIHVRATAVVDLERRLGHVVHLEMLHPPQLRQPPTVLVPIDYCIDWYCGAEGRVFPEARSIRALCVGRNGGFHFHCHYSYNRGQRPSCYPGCTVDYGWIAAE